MNCHYVDEEKQIKQQEGNKKERVKQELTGQNTLLTENDFRERARINDMAMRNFERMGIIEPWIFKENGTSAHYYQAKTADRIRLMQTYLIGNRGVTKNLRAAYERACKKIK